MEFGIKSVGGEQADFFVYICNMESVVQTLVEIFAEWGYVGMFVAALVAGSLVPFCSEAVLLLLVGLGSDPVWCVLSATAGNTLGGMTCYGIGRLGKTEWIGKRLKISDAKMARAKRFMGNRGAVMGFFAFLPYIGGAIAVLLGVMRSNPWITAAAMFVGKIIRYAVIAFAVAGAM